MGARWLKREEKVIRRYYPTASRAEILELIPDRTWNQIGVHARHMRVLRTTTAWGNSIREGRKKLIHSWSDADNERFDLLYPIRTYAQLLAAFPERSRISIRSHAQKRHIYRTKEAKARQVKIGREEVMKKT